MLSKNSNNKGHNIKRLTRRLSWDDEGVSSTIGTIMAMMIFLTFLSMFMNQYVPIWMEDNEATHMNDVEGEFATLKHSINIQILAGMMGKYDVSLYSPVTLGAQGIPMFAAPTMGQLSVNPDPADSKSEINWVYNVTGASSPEDGNRMFWSNSSGMVRLLVPNRYFVIQTMVYENDAIILSQKEGELVKAPPQITFRQEGSRYNMVITQISMIGNNQTFNGFDNRGITTYLRSATTATYDDVDSTASVPTDALTGWIYVNQTTHYGSAWYSYLNNTMAKYNFADGTEYTLTKNWINTTYDDDPTEIVSLGINSDKISALTINQAYFNVVIGDSGVSP